MTREMAIFTKEKSNTDLTKYKPKPFVYTNVQSSITHNSQKLETTQMSNN